MPVVLLNAHSPRDDVSISSLPVLLFNGKKDQVNIFETRKQALETLVDNFKATSVYDGDNSGQVFDKDGSEVGSDLFRTGNNENIFADGLFSFTPPIKHGDIAVNIGKPSSVNNEMEDKELVLANILSSSVNLLKTFIGAGIISLPLAMSSFGLLTGAVLMIVAGMTSLVGLYFYIFCADRIGGRHVTPHAIAAITRPFLGYLLNGCVTLKTLGVGLAYLLLVGNIMSTMMKGFFSGNTVIWANPRLWIGVFMGLVIGPLSFLRRMDHLKYSSTLGLISVVYLLVLSIVHFFAKGITPSAQAAIYMIAPFSIKSLSRFGIIVFAFTCHQNMLPIYNESRKNSVRELLNLCAGCVFISLAIYITYGTFSYLCYADVLVGGSMFSYYPNEVPFQIARILFAFLLAFSYPLQVVPFRMASQSLFQAKESVKSYLISTIFMLSVTFGVSMFLPDLSNVLSLVGSMTSSVICYIVPSLFYLSIRKDDPFWESRKHWAYSMLVFGIIVFLTCTSMSIVNFVIS